MCSPLELADIWQGCGGSTQEHTQSALKLQVQFELLTGALIGPCLQHGRAHDLPPGQPVTLPAGSLRLADLGYFRLEHLCDLSHAGVYWLSRLHLHTSVFDHNGTGFELCNWLTQQKTEILDVPVLGGRSHHLPARLLVVKVPAQVAELRRERLRQEARRQGRTVSKRHLALAGWTILVTNVPVTQLSVAEALVLLRARWQIELLFKLWKSHGLLDESRSANPWRGLCELYAKLLVLLVQHWLLVLSCWQYPDRSLMQAAQTIQRYATSLALALPHLKRLAAVITSIQRCLQVGCRITRRCKQPSTYHLLLEEASSGSTVIGWRERSSIRRQKHAS